MLACNFWQFSKGLLSLFFFCISLSLLHFPTLWSFLKFIFIFWSAKHSTFFQPEKKKKKISWSPEILTKKYIHPRNSVTTLKFYIKFSSVHVCTTSFCKHLLHEYCLQSTDINIDRCGPTLSLISSWRGQHETSDYLTEA